MKKFLSVIIILFLLTTSTFSKSGKGDVTLSKKAMETFLDYLYGGAKNLNAKTGGSTNNMGQKTKPLLFTLSETGDAYLYNYCSFSTCRDPNKYQAILKCQKYSNGTPCFTFATKKKIVWKNDQNPKGLSLKKELKHGRNHVSQLIKDAGYYKGDITLLRGFQSETISLSKNKNSSNTNTKKVEKKKEPKITKKKVIKKAAKKYELKGERSIALSWDGYDDLIAGTVEFNEADYQGKLNLALPNNDGTCKGSYSLQEGGKGTWQIACTNSMGAAGTLKWSKKNGVTGSGRDHNDKKVKFTVSKKS